MSDPIRPDHYKTGDGKQVIDYINEAELGFHLGNVAKYVIRANKKGNPKQDLEKACEYLRMYYNSTERSNVSKIHVSTHMNWMEKFGVELELSIWLFQAVSGDSFGARSNIMQYIGRNYAEVSGT